MQITYLELLNKIKNKEINPYNYYIKKDSIVYKYNGFEFVDKDNITLLSKFIQSQNSILYSTITLEKQNKKDKNREFENKTIRRAKKDIIEELWDMYLSLKWDIDACQGCMSDLDKQFRKVDIYQGLLEYMGVCVTKDKEEKFHKWYSNQVEKSRQKDLEEKRFEKSLFGHIEIPFDIRFNPNNDETTKLLVNTSEKVNDILNHLYNLSNNNLELGNIAFNTNKNQNYRCPNYIVALLFYLNKQLERVMFNKNQKEYESPFMNTGNYFENDIFKVQAYSWNDDIEQEYNFLYKPENIKISWYKYLGRDTTINNLYNPNIIINMFDKCLNSLIESDKDYLN